MNQEINLDSEDRKLKKEIKIIGHRGSRGNFIENTLPAFFEAYDCKAFGAELDLQITKDNKVIIYHDYEFSPLKKLIKDLNYEQIRACLFSDGSMVPRLEELFESFQDKKPFHFTLEVKRDLNHPEWTKDVATIVELIIEVVKKHKFENRVLYSSFDVQTLQMLKRKDPNANLAFLCESHDFSKFRVSNFFKQIKEELSLKVLSPPSSVITDDSLKYLRSICDRIIVWTVNDADDFKRLTDLGIDEIITDTPRKFSLKK
jgi:glycerophosphoryl diester phosphodiesterase